MSKVIEKKVTLNELEPNYLIKKWLIQLLENARQTKSKLIPMLELALESISKYPVQLNSGAECMVLKGFGKNLCSILDKCMQAYNEIVARSSGPLRELSVEEEVGRPDSPATVSASSASIPYNKNIPQNNSSSTSSQVLNQENLTADDNSLNHSDAPVISGSRVVDVGTDNISDSHHSNNLPSTVHNRQSAKKSSSKKYIPAFNSGGYAILMALREHAIECLDKPSMSKEALIEKAQLYSKESFVRAKPNTHYTAWSNMSKLIKIGLVQMKRQFSKKPEYSLTRKGIELAQEVYTDAERKTQVNDIIFINDNDPLISPNSLDNNIEEDNNNLMDIDDNIPSTSQSLPSIELKPGTFDIILLIDKCETPG